MNHINTFKFNLQTTNDSFSNKENIKIKREKIIAYIKGLSDDPKMRFWIKTLLSSYNIFPEIIKTVDKIIELQATSISFATDIYNGESTTYNQMEKVIDLSERKNALLNIFIMTKQIIKTLNTQDFDFLEKKFVFGWNAEDLSKEFNISVRTVYRKVDKLIDEIYHNLKRKNWSLRFLESQIKGESWLKEKFIKITSDYFKNSNYQTHNKSSSDSYDGNAG